MRRSRGIECLVIAPLCALHQARRHPSGLLGSAWVSPTLVEYGVAEAQSFIPTEKIAPATPLVTVDDPLQTAA